MTDYPGPPPSGQPPSYPPYGQPAPYQPAPYGTAPYGQYQPEPSGQYGATPPGWYPMPYGQPPGPRSLDGWSVAGLVCGILPTVVLGLIFSVVGLIRTGNPMRRGRAFAVAGLLLSLAWLAGIIALGAVGDSSNGHQQPQPVITGAQYVDPFDLVVGDCFQQAPLTGQTSVTTVPRLPCDQPHNAMVVATVEPPNTSYPGISTLLDQAVAMCRTEALNYLNRPLGRLRYAAFAPHEALWTAGHKTASCVLYDPSRNFTGDIRQDR